MGWKVKTKTEKDITKYRIWTTISDGWITDWSTKEEITKFFFWHHFHKMMDGFLEDAMTFPNGYHDKDTGSRIMDAKIQDDFTGFMHQRHKVNGKEYTEVTTDKFSEILNCHGIRMKIEDERGYDFDSKDENDIKQMPIDNPPNHNGYSFMGRLLYEQAGYYDKGFYDNYKDEGKCWMDEMGNKIQREELEKYTYWLDIKPPEK